MSKILLDYAFKITALTPIPSASTSFLKQVCLIVKPKGGVDPGFYECSSMTAVGLKTDNEDAEQFFDAGMSKVFLLCSNDLDVATEMATDDALNFFTLIASSDFREKYASLEIQDLTLVAKTAGTGGNSTTFALADTASGDVASVSVVGSAISVSVDAGTTKMSTIVTALLASTAAMTLLGSVEVAEGHEDDTAAAVSATNLAGGAAANETLAVGTFKGVVGISSVNTTFLNAQAVIENRCAFYGSAENLCFAFGSLLANPSNWRNQQYIQMPVDDSVSLLGDAETYFDKKYSFVINDSEFGNRLALFACGGKAITAPYILRNLEIDLQSRALTWINANQPDFTLTEATLLEDRLNQDVIIAKYIALRWIPAGKVEISLVEDNFVANGNIEVTEPRALWRIVGEMVSQ